MTTHYLRVWKHYHWAFFTLIQGLSLALICFERSLQKKNLKQAEIFLKAAADMMMGSGAAMQLAGSFKRHHYDREIRPTMAPPYVASQEFSGLSSVDHAFLVSILIGLKKPFENLPTLLISAHQQFIGAYESLLNAHVAVCEKFGGKESASLRSPGSNALSTLEKMNRGRLQLINPFQRFHRDPQVNPPENHASLAAIPTQTISRCPFRRLLAKG